MLSNYNRANIRTKLDFFLRITLLCKTSSP